MRELDEWQRDIALLIPAGYAISAVFYASGWTPLPAAITAPLIGVATYLAIELHMADDEPEADIDG